MSLIIGVPAGKLTQSEFWANLYTWLLTTKIQASFVPRISNRVDLNRSGIIQTAKEQNNADVIMIDSDVVMKMSIDEVYKLVQQDFKKGFDIVLGASIGVSGKPIVPYKETDVYEVQAGSMTFVAISGKLIAKLEPISTYTTVGNDQSPMYFAYSTQTSEDVYFCLRSAMLYNAKTCVDKRIKFDHIQPVHLSMDNYEEIINASKTDL